MKKLLFILALFFTLSCGAQGIKCTGVVYTDSSTLFHIDSLFVYPIMSNYKSLDSTGYIVIPNFAASRANAKIERFVYSPSAYSIPTSIMIYFKSTMGTPSNSYLFTNVIQPYLFNTYRLTVLAIP